MGTLSAEKDMIDLFIVRQETSFPANIGGKGGVSSKKKRGVQDRKQLSYCNDLRVRYRSMEEDEQVEEDTQHDSVT
jgi:hypothetical protein